MGLWFVNDRARIDPPPPEKMLHTSEDELTPVEDEESEPARPVTHRTSKVEVALFYIRRIVVVTIVALWLSETRLSWTQSHSYNYTV